MVGFAFCLLVVVEREGVRIRVWAFEHLFTALLLSMDSHLALGHDANHYLALRACMSA